MAATFYIEPVLTYDLGVFVALPVPSADIISLSGLYDALLARGYKPEDEFVVIEDIPVQFLPPYNALIEEALAEARSVKYKDVPTRVFGPEHLVAISVQTGREKDRQRVREVKSQNVLDKDILKKLLSKHRLTERWLEWNRYTLKSRSSSRRRKSAGANWPLCPITRKCASSSSYRRWLRRSFARAGSMCAYGISTMNRATNLRGHIDFRTRPHCSLPFQWRQCQHIHRC